MKKELLALALIIAATSVKAAEYSGNPDRFPSIGVAYTGQALSGDSTVTSAGLSAKQDIDAVSGLLSIDTRIPVSNSVTLFGLLGVAGSNVKGEETDLLAGGEDDLGGLTFSVGARFYLR